MTNYRVPVLLLHPLIREDFLAYTFLLGSYIEQSEEGTNAQQPTDQGLAFRWRSAVQPRQPCMHEGSIM